LQIARKQVNLEKGYIRLTPEQTKTNEGRKVPISPLLHQTISAMRKRTGSVFKPEGRRVDGLKRAFRKLCEKVGIENFRFHDFRHTFVTNMRRAGKQDRVIMAITGHKTMSMLMRYDTVGEDEILQAVGAEFEKPGTILAQAVEPEDRVGA
jgi:integrase